ncbi:MAG: hypothetical protein WBV78_20580, partial [Roseobacter sp.]
LLEWLVGHFEEPLWVLVQALLAFVVGVQDRGSPVASPEAWPAVPILALSAVVVAKVSSTVCLAAVAMELPSGFAAVWHSELASGLRPYL